MGFRIDARRLRGLGLQAFEVFQAFGKGSDSASLA